MEGGVLEEERARCRAGEMPLVLSLLKEEEEEEEEEEDINNDDEPDHSSSSSSFSSSSSSSSSPSSSKNMGFRIFNNTPGWMPPAFSPARK